VHEFQWIPLPLDGARLAELVIFGNGKDSDVTIKLAGGRVIEIPVEDVRVVTGEGIIVHSVRYDDVSRIVRFSGQGLSIRHARVAWPGEDEECVTGLAEDLPAFLDPENEQVKYLRYVVDAEFELERHETPSGLVP
jgi:hypothetical protein